MPAQHRKKLYCLFPWVLLFFFIFLPVSSVLSAQREEGVKRGEPLPLQNSFLTILKDREYFLALKEAIDKAKDDINMSFFRFKTEGKAGNYPNVILASLGGAAKRGVKVLVLLEQSKDVVESTDKENRQTMGKLKKMGVNVYLDSPKRTMHTKMAVIDRKYTFIGSHNLTQSALKYNNEMSVMIESPKVAAEALGYIKALVPGQQM
jgi:phosphatidylserine/phosphatidylglycerophosphate/cardiolipin synthase-like enzyme